MLAKYFKKHNEQETVFLEFLTIFRLITKNNGKAKSNTIHIYV